MEGRGKLRRPLTFPRREESRQIAERIADDETRVKDAKRGKKKVPLGHYYFFTNAVKRREGKRGNGSPESVINRKGRGGGMVLDYLATTSPEEKRKKKKGRPAPTGIWLRRK